MLYNALVCNFMSCALNMKKDGVNLCTTRSVISFFLSKHPNFSQTLKRHQLHVLHTSDHMNIDLNKSEAYPIKTFTHVRPTDPHPRKTMVSEII